MDSQAHRPVLRTLTSAILVLSVGILLVGFQSSNSQPPDNNSSVSKGVELDRELVEAYLHRDWRALENIVAPEYHAITPDFEWRYADLKNEFPKVQMTSTHIERQVVKPLASDILLVSEIAAMRETYAGQDISGRYWISDVWVRRNGKWLLLVEQEVQLK